jgi:hypothetical protein
MIDNYALKARYYPVVILFFPVLVLGVFYSFQFDSLVHALTSIGVVGAFTYLFSQLGRDQGKIKEPALWEGWGGAPSVQLLRLRDDHLDKHTKERYHKLLRVLCPLSASPDQAMETSDPHAADEVYRAWTKYLIAQTRDTKKFPLLFKDNTSYGFRRNLWGLKPFALLIVTVLIVGNYSYWALKLKTSNLLYFPESFKYSTATLFAIVLFWVVIVSKIWIRIAAFSYAERLCECVETL